MADIGGLIGSYPCPADGCDETLHLVAGPLGVETNKASEPVTVTLCLSAESKAHLRTHG